MKKIGFTLAEVLITLGIIGVVAALAAPALMTETQKAKVGPSIRKMMSTLEVANEHILNDNEASSLSAIFDTDTDAYLEELNKYAKGIIEEDDLSKIKISPTNIKGGDDHSPLKGTDLVFKIYTFAAGDAIAIAMYNRGNYVNGSYKGNIANFWYDMNGFDKKPNRTGKDLFLFRMDDSGSIYPDGGKTQKAVQPNRDANLYWWSSKGWGACNEDTVSYGMYCGASVVDNNYKVVYKY